MNKSHNFWLNTWYGGAAPWAYLLLPLSWLFRIISLLRKFYLVTFAQQSLPVPVIVVGNISVGGTGKTPLLIALVQYLQQRGYKPGVVSRGYGGTAPHYPYAIDTASTANEAGDEPLLIFNATQCQVCVAPDRVAAAELLIEHGCNIILSDDGLQHYRLGRDMEIAVIDGVRLFGNRRCLPAGPLREPVSRLRSVDLLVVNNPQSPQPLKYPSYAMQVAPAHWRHLRSQRLIPLDQLTLEKNFHALAGIGNPQRFYHTLESMSLSFQPHSFADHHQFKPADLAFAGESPLVMTEKDAVKCSAFAGDHWYSLVVKAQLPESFWQTLQQKLDLLQDLHQ
ncbi:MAG TPA: tetraacyldisaccharide 4'-kinase [Cellvibrio sp.]|nr:tetraacyldisaccharide 4'-kinase [Cellvibrio sp.]